MSFDFKKMRRKEGEGGEEKERERERRWKGGRKGKSGVEGSKSLNVTSIVEKILGTIT